MRSVLENARDIGDRPCIGQIFGESNTERSASVCSLFKRKDGYKKVADFLAQTIFRTAEEEEHSFEETEQQHRGTPFELFGSLTPTQ